MTRRLDISDHALGLMSSFSYRKLMHGQHSALGSALSLAIVSEMQLRKGEILKSIGFVPPVMLIEDLPPVLSSLIGYANGTWDRGIRSFIVLVIGDIVAAAEEARARNETPHGGRGTSNPSSPQKLDRVGTTCSPETVPRGGGLRLGIWSDG